MEREKQNTNQWAIKSGNGHKIREIRPKRWGKPWWEGFIEKVWFKSFNSGNLDRRNTDRQTERETTANILAYLHAANL